MVAMVARVVSAEQRSPTRIVSWTCAHFSDGRFPLIGNQTHGLETNLRQSETHSVLTSLAEIG